MTEILLWVTLVATASWFVPLLLFVSASVRFRKMRKRKDNAYWERNNVVAALARWAVAQGYRAGVTRTDIPDWDPEWHGCVYIDLPTGQVSWHFHDSQASLFEGLPEYSGAWDGHTTPEKYARLAKHQQAAPGGEVA